MNKSFAIYTFGCKLNFSESSDMARRLREQGWQESDEPEAIIVNSCAVTHAAEKKVRNYVAHLHREYPNARIVVVGCYASLQAEVIRQWAGVEAVFGNRDKLHAVNYILGLPIPEIPTFFSTYSSNDRTRSFLKIQDGCDYYCTYCTVAAARGESRSDSIEHVLQNIEKIHVEGLKEVNITGVNLGTFGKGTDENFYDLLKAIDKQHLVERVRISSIEPNLLTDEIIELVAKSDILMPHFHIPLQSGCDKTLAMMKRRYKRALFQDKIMKIKQLMPDACIAIDIIAGFPGETEEDFRDSYDFVKSLPLSYLHVFTYSRRPGTPAAAMKEQVPEQVKHDRTNRLLELSETKKRFFYHEHVGETRPVLWESENVDGKMFGFTDNYIKVAAPFNPDWVNTIKPYFLTEEQLIVNNY
ncbi:MAG: tRNA (N(6)-L-threonylcarbamoyladenosine(37)-C(2))-methylthiotransferase MtaB [Bacteroidales bacterium]|nr:tRNA (N(6)-L-threonylcarbamoyladenosine(37)-C(2))-methylthiotransferase MtaB [Bacteroidales bacterium]